MRINRLGVSRPKVGKVVSRQTDKGNQKFKV